MSHEKRCTACNVLKPSDQFNKARRGRHGLRATCRACDSNAHKEWAAWPRERVVVKAKTCRTCRRHLPAEDFPALKTAADGLNTQCKRCVKEKVGQRHLRDPKKRKSYQTRYTAAHRDAAGERTRKWISAPENKERRRKWKRSCFGQNVSPSLT